MACETCAPPQTARSAGTRSSADRQLWRGEETVANRAADAEDLKKRLSFGHARPMDRPPELNVSQIATAMQRAWDTAEIRPERGLERVELRDGDLYVEMWATAGSLHQVTVRAADLLAIDA